jgi:flotillin
MTDSTIPIPDKLPSPTPMTLKSSQEMPLWKKAIVGVSGTALAGVGALIAVRYHVCKPEQFLVRTGLGIKDMSIQKHAIQWPFQRVSFINMSPITYEFQLHNMSKEKVEFKLPVVFTVGPVDPRTQLNEFKNYARMMNDLSPEAVRDTIGGMVEGETRGQTAQMTIEEMFSQKDVFRETVVSKIEEDLQKLGLRIFNANIKEMADFDSDNKYFEYRKQRAIETANYEAQVQVAEAKKIGEIGVQERLRDTRIARAEMDQAAILAENKREEMVEQSKADLEEVKAESFKRSEIAKINAEMMAKQTDMELQRELEEKRREQQIEAMRAEKLSSAIAESEAMERLADAKLYQEKAIANAHVYTEQQKAMGIEAVYNAQADGLNKLAKSAEGDSSFAKFYLGLENGLYEKLAKESSNAVQGLNPKINVWNTGSNTDDNNDASKPIINLMKSFAPALDGLQEQANVQIPRWLPQIGKTKGILNKDMLDKDN